MPVCDQFPRPSVEASALNDQNDIDKLNNLRAKNLQNPFFHITI